MHGVITLYVHINLCKATIIVQLDQPDESVYKCPFKEMTADRRQQTAIKRAPNLRHTALRPAFVSSSVFL